MASLSNVREAAKSVLDSNAFNQVASLAMLANYILATTEEDSDLEVDEETVLKWGWEWDDRHRSMHHKNLRAGMLHPANKSNTQWHFILSNAKICSIENRHQFRQLMTGLGIKLTSD